MTSAAPKGRGALRPASLVERRMTRFMREPPSVRLAASVIVTATGLIVVIGGVLMRVVDHAAYGSIWVGMWWVLQTVTTVGYGDAAPNNTAGYLLTSFVMLEGIAFLTIVTAAITSSFVARAEGERAEQSAPYAGGSDAEIAARLDRLDAHVAELAAGNRQLDERLEQLQALLESPPPRREG